MHNDLLVAGIACLIAALVGGGLKAFTIEIPLLSSVRRQIMLGLLGAFFFGFSLILWKRSESSAPPLPSPQSKHASVSSPSLSPPTSQPTNPEISLTKSSFLLPQDGVEMDNGAVGPFCCTGHAVIVRSADGNPVGYVYFYSWKGQAYNVEGGSIVPDVSILVSGPITLANGGSDQQKNQIDFQAVKLNPQSSWIQAGLLQYRATLLDYKVQRGPLFAPYFKMDSSKFRIDVRPAKSG